MKDIVHRRCCGLDVHKDSIAACVRWADEHPCSGSRVAGEREVFRGAVGCSQVWPNETPLLLIGYNRRTSVLSPNESSRSVDRRPPARSVTRGCRD